MPQLSSDMVLVLASRSPQRVMLMREAGFKCICDPADIDETNFPANVSPANIARHLALEKARCTAARHSDDLTLGADTVVAHGSTLLGKPEDAKHAAYMLRMLSGSTHSVITGVALCCPSRKIELIDHEESTVVMRTLTVNEIETYVASNQWQGKAGGYGIQDPDPFVTCIQGSRSNVVGLPIDRVIDLLRQAGFNH